MAVCVCNAGLLELLMSAGISFARAQGRFRGGGVGGVGFRLCAHVFDLSIPVSHVRLGLESGPASDMCGQTQTVTNIDPSYPRGTVYLSYVRGLGDV